MIASVADVERARTTGVPLIDARPVDQYLGRSKELTARVAGTIPSAVGIDNVKFFDEKTGTFSTKAMVAALLEDVGVRQDGEEIAFCNTGHWASVAWFGIGEILSNKKAKVFVGSMTEWTKDAARPVEVKAK